MKRTSYPVLSLAQGFESLSDFVKNLATSVDMVFPLIHCRFGEDGGIQARMWSYWRSQTFLSLVHSPMNVIKHLTNCSHGIPCSFGLFKNPTNTKLPSKTSHSFPGVIAATFVCPLDVIKTRLQVQGLPQLINTNIKGSVIVGSLEQIFQKEGSRCMWCLHCFQIGQCTLLVYGQLKSFLGADGI